MYMYMRFPGGKFKATTFWEYEDAPEKPSGSHCHGWSALPVYYYERFSPEGG